MWSPADIVDAAAAGLARAAQAMDLEDAVRGLDDLPERQVQETLASAFAEAGWIVAREVRYPSSRPRSKAAGARCDLVLTHDAALQPDAEASLFDPVDPAPPESACWIEVKVAAAMDVEGASAAYARTLSHTAIADAAVLASEAQLHHALLLMVLFGRDESTLRQDVRTWVDEARIAGVQAETPRVRTFALRERRGNATAAVVGVPIRCAAGDITN